MPASPRYHLQCLSARLYRRKDSRHGGLMRARRAFRHCRATCKLQHATRLACHTARLRMRKDHICHRQHPNTSTQSLSNSITHNISLRLRLLLHMLRRSSILLTGLHRCKAILPRNTLHSSKLGITPLRCLPSLNSKTSPFPPVLEPTLWQRPEPKALFPSNSTTSRRCSLQSISRPTRLYRNRRSPHLPTNSNRASRRTHHRRRRISSTKVPCTFVTRQGGLIL